MEIVRGLHAFVWRDFQITNCNTYLIRASKNILIDPGLHQGFDRIGAALSDLGLSPGKIDLVLITHSHYDHMEAVQRFGQATLVALGSKELEFMKTSSAFLPDQFAPDILLEEGDLETGDVSLRIFSTPGHSPGSVCVYWPDRQALFSGDLIFNHGIGRTDLPGGRGRSLKESIQRMAELEIEYLLPGHGEIISGKDAVRDNFREIEEVWFPYLE